MHVLYTCMNAMRLAQIEKNIVVIVYISIMSTTRMRDLSLTCSSMRFTIIVYYACSERLDVSLFKQTIHFHSSWHAH